MGLIKRIAVWRDRRHNLIQINYEISRLWDEFHDYVAKGDLKDGTREFDELYSEYRSYLEIPESEREVVLTTIAIQRANYWLATWPPRPSRGSEYNQFWDWNRVANRHLLTAEGHRFIRHQIAEERDIAYRPFLAWGAVVISLSSLIVSLLKS